MHLPTSSRRLCDRLQDPITVVRLVSLPRDRADRRRRAPYIMVSSYHLAVVGIVASLVAHGLSSPLTSVDLLDKRGENLALNKDFPDPSIEQVSH